MKGNPLIREKLQGSRHVFGHKYEFPCMKQPANSMTEAFYAIHHIQEFERDELELELPQKLTRLQKDFANYSTDADVRCEFYRIQQKLARVICRDVLQPEGLFYYGPVPSNRVMEKILRKQEDYREFRTLEGFRPFPPTDESL